jgi:hypothetical protein
MRGGDLFEAPAVAFERGDLAGPRLPRRTVTSQYRGSSSTSRACRPAFAQAIKVEPEPANGSRTMSRDLLEFLTARSTSATGFIVG